MYGVSIIPVRALAKRLLITYIAITQKEYDVIMWQCCNLPSTSPLVVSLKKLLKELIAKEELAEKVNAQTKLNL